MHRHWKMIRYCWMRQQTMLTSYLQFLMKYTTATIERTEAMLVYCFDYKWRSNYRFCINKVICAEREGHDGRAVRGAKNYNRVILLLNYLCLYTFQINHHRVLMVMNIIWRYLCQNKLLYFRCACNLVWCGGTSAIQIERWTDSESGKEKEGDSDRFD